LFGFLRRRNSKRKEEEQVEARVERPTPPTDFTVFRKRNPRIASFGSPKGGVGKSTLASIAVVTLAVHGLDTVAVDLDLDNETLTTLLLPEEYVEHVRSIAVRSRRPVLSFSSLILEEPSFNYSIITLNGRYQLRTRACTGQEVFFPLRLVPAVDPRVNYHRLRKKLNVQLERYGYRDYRDATLQLYQEMRNRMFHSVFDLKQKSNVASSREILYSVAGDKSDVFFIVTDPSNLDFQRVMSPFTAYYDHLVVIINKVERQHLPAVRDFIRESLREQVPVFVVPFDEFALTATTKTMLSPALSDLSAKACTSVGGILSFFYDYNASVGCEKFYREYREKHQRLWEALSKR